MNATAILSERHTMGHYPYLYERQTPPAPSDGTVVYRDSLTRIRLIAVATCAHCAWQASMTGDTLLELRAFLQKVLHAHVVDTHVTQ